MDDRGGRNEPAGAARNAHWAEAALRVVARWHARRHWRAAGERDDFVQDVMVAALQWEARAGQRPSLPLVLGIARNVWRRRVHQLVRDRRCVDIDECELADRSATAPAVIAAEGSARLRRWVRFYLRASEAEWQLVLAVAARRGGWCKAAAALAIAPGRATFLRRRFRGLCADSALLESLRYCAPSLGGCRETTREDGERP